MKSAPSHQNFKDILNIFFFIIAVIIGAWLINAAVFRSFNVSGPSMEPTLFTGDRLIVNRIPVTFQTLQSKQYVPGRGHVIVFKNPLFRPGTPDEYIVKRVIGLPGDRVVISGGTITIFNPKRTDGFDPYADTGIAQAPVRGVIDETVETGKLFVIGDNRAGQLSLDSRNGLGTIPFENIVGPVVIRIFPFTKISTDF